MTDTALIPELKQIIGALLFAAREPVSVETIRKVLRDAARQFEGPAQDFAKATEKDIVEALHLLNEELVRQHTGMHLGEVANGYRLQNDLNCGIWIRQMLEKGRSNRLSKPALETLAIIAYRQPCTRAEVEAVRGVSVDAILRNLMEMQLVKAAGRSELPGRPWLFATTQKFLEYFGLRNVQDLPGIEELRRMEKAQAEARRNEAVTKNDDAEAPDSGEQPELFPESGDVPDGDADEEAFVEDDVVIEENPDPAEDPAMEAEEAEADDDDDDEDEFDDDDDDEDEFEDEEEFDDEEDDDEDDGNRQV